jgi:hypothetical protein
MYVCVYLLRSAPTKRLRRRSLWGQVRKKRFTISTKKKRETHIKLAFIIKKNQICVRLFFAGCY